MVYDATVPMEEVKRCILCHEASCSENCPKGAEPAQLIRSLYFHNEIGAASRIARENPCIDCSAPCEKACRLLDAPIKIRTILSALSEDQKQMEQLPLEPADLSCKFCGIRLENPFLLSSSVVASSYEMIARAFEMGWAGAAYKTLCDFIPREASPRFAVLRGDGKSFYGFKNIEQLSCNDMKKDLEIIARLKHDFPNKVIFASIMGRNEDEWTSLARRCEEAGADLIECNFSCPNMEQGGLGVDIGQSPELVAKYTAAARRGCSIPILAKLTPNVADMTPMAIAAIQNGADGLAAINTIKSIMGMNLDTYAAEPSVRGLSGVGGYSGKAVKPIALRFIWEMAAHPALKNVPITGMGGIETWEDAVDFLVLGAQNVQITTAVMQYGYRIIDDLLDGLSCYMGEKSITRVADLVGMGVDNVIALDELERGSIRYPKFLRKHCIGCGRCYLACRDGGHNAIEMKEDKPILRVQSCVGCQLCVAVCPNGAISGSSRRRPAPLERGAAETS